MCKRASKCALSTPLTGALGHQNLLTMATCMAVFFALAAGAAIALRDAAPDSDDDNVATVAGDARREPALV